MCPECGTTLQVVCGEFVCGTCYGRALTAEPYRTPRPALAPPAYPCCGQVYWTMRIDPHHYCGKGMARA